jgi:serine/threonine protein kinase
MPLIGQGNYGCVFKPYVSCKNNTKKFKDSIGKVFVDESEFQSEKTIQDRIKKLDPNNTFTVPLYTACDVKSFKNKDNVESCELIKNINQEYSQLIYKYGGISLKDVIKGQGSIKNFMDIFVKLRPILIGLKKMIESNLIHQDIKPPNILYDKYKLYLIDFGILIESQKVYTMQNNYVLKYDYPYYPPEYKLYSNNKTFDEYYEKVIKNFDFDFHIGKKHVNLLEIIRDNIGVDIVDDLNIAFKKRKQTFNPSKIDLYSLGIVILELYIWSGLYIKTYKTNNFNKKLQSNLVEFIKGILRFNSIERFDIETAIIVFDKIVHLWNNKK